MVTRAGFLCGAKKVVARRLFRVIFIVMLVLVVIDIIQLIFPRDIALPFRKIDNLHVGLQNRHVITSRLWQAYDNQQLTIVNNAGQTIIKPLGDLGIYVDVNNQTEQVLEYPLWQRFIPFSFIWDLVESPPISPPVVEASGQTDFYCSDPVDAKIEVKDSNLSVQPSVGGCSFDSNAFLDALLGLELNAKTHPTLYFDIEIIEPHITTETAEEVIGKIEQNVIGGVDLAVDDVSMHVTRAEVIDMLEFVNDTENHTITVNVNDNRLRTLVEHSTLGDKAQTIKNTVIHVVNGIETGRDSGNPGISIDYNQLITDLLDVTTNHPRQIDVKLINTAPQIIYQRSYSNDWNGLVAQMNDKNAGKSYAIAVLDLSGRGRNMFINADRQFTAASTYKLFTAYSMFRSGNPPTCLDVMIINSDNACPESFLASYGYANSQQDAHSIGANSTFFQPRDMRTTARDLSTFLKQIYNGSILSPNDNSRLLNNMKTQRFSSGIPAGIGNNGVVADKVGFLWGLLHDAGIVYSDRGDYVEVILTDGYSWNQIAETAWLIHGYM